MIDHDNPKLAKVGDLITLELPYSEVCMHMRMAGQVHSVRVTEHGARIVFGDEEAGAWSPVTHGEAGLYRTDQPGIFR